MGRVKRQSEKEITANEELGRGKSRPVANQGGWRIREAIGSGGDAAKGGKEGHCRASGKKKSEETE